MKHSIAHDLDPATVRRVADKALASYRQKYPDADPRVSWRSETQAELTFRVKGVSLRGALSLEPDAIQIEMDVPLLFRPFRAVALRVVEDEIRKWLAEAKAGRV